MTIKRKPADIIVPGVLAQSGYHTPCELGLIKLDAMENPYPLPEALWADLAQSMRQVDINRYPSQSAEALKETVRETLDIDDDTAFMLGNGSDELIQIIALATARTGSKWLSVGPTFSMYRVIASTLGIDYIEVDLNDDFSLNLEAMLAAIEKENPSVIFLAYPNNPTGNLLTTVELDAILAIATGLVVIDEAYHAFAQETMMHRIKDNDNLLVMRTLSKLGLAGARFGYLCGHSDWIDQLEKVRLPYNVNSMTQCLIDTVLPRIDLFEDQASDMVKDRDQLFDEMKAIDALTVYPSDANFLLFRVDDALTLYQHLIDHGILIRMLHGSHPLLDNCLRVSVGLPEENARFLDALRAGLLQ